MQQVDTVFPKGIFCLSREDEKEAEAMNQMLAEWIDEHPGCVVQAFSFDFLSGRIGGELQEIIPRALVLTIVFDREAH